MSGSALTPERMRPTPVDEAPLECRTPKLRRVVMLALIPSNPPCFEPDVWRGYVLDCAEQHPKGGPLTWLHGEPLYNRAWSYCHDCKAQHAVTMDRQGRCHPDFHRRPANAGGAE